MPDTYPENQQHNSFNTPWTTERDEMLKQLWADGYSASLIADKLANGSKLTRCAVIGRAHRLELPARKDRPPLQRKPQGRKPYRRANGSMPKPPRPQPPPRPPKPPPPPPSMELNMRKLPLVQLAPNQCRWPLGELMDVAHLFCGADKDDSSSYCPAHHRLAHPPETRRGTLSSFPKDYPRAW